MLHVIYLTLIVSSVPQVI